MIWAVLGLLALAVLLFWMTRQNNDSPEARILEACHCIHEHLTLLEVRLMSQLSDKIAEVSAKIDVVAAAQADASTSQTAEIVRVEALIAAFPPPVSAADIAALDALNVKLDDLKATEAAQKAEADAERP